VNVDLTPDQRALVTRAIESGRFSHQEEVVREALALWEERERRRFKDPQAETGLDDIGTSSRGRAATSTSLTA
jgi:putative addiction module CopG family antidote